MSPRLLRMLSDPAACFDVPATAIVRLDGCNARARRWRAAGCHGVWLLSADYIIGILDAA